VSVAPYRAQDCQVLARPAARGPPAAGMCYNPRDPSDRPKERSMIRVPHRTLPLAGAALLALFLAAPIASLDAQSKTAPPAGKTQKIDEAYTAKIKEYTTDPRVITELVDHLPASDTIPTPLKFFGRIPGTPDELTYSKDIYRYFDALDAASDRVKV